MKRIFLVLLMTALGTASAGAYIDERGHNLDSLERAVAPWTPDAIDQASEQELQELNRAYRDLMLGYNVINGEKSDFYARKALSISLRQGWNGASLDAYRYIGMHFYGNEQYDSALVYYGKAMEMADLLAASGTASLDDEYSALYGTLGNLYNVMGDLPTAMEYYEKAGEIFERNGWNESLSILHYNIGETWVDHGDLRKAAKAYDQAMTYAQASGDSLLIVNALKGYGRLYMEKGRTGKSLRYLREADAYYAAHPDFSPGFRTENLDYMKVVLSRQKYQLGLLTGILVGLLLMAAGLVFARRKKKANAPPVMSSADAVPAMSSADADRAMPSAYAVPAMSPADADPAMPSADAVPVMSSADADHAMSSADAVPAMSSADAARAMPSAEDTPASPAPVPAGNGAFLSSSVPAGNGALPSSSAPAQNGALPNISAPAEEGIPQLTDREKDILSLLAKGYTAPQIAEALSLSPETIRWYRKKLLVKFDVANSPELIFQAREKGVL